MRSAYSVSWKASSASAARALRLGLADAVHPGLQHQLLAGGGLVPGAAALGDVADAAAHLARVLAQVGAGDRRPRRRRASSRVASIRRVVVLPAPLGPRKPKISPSATLEVDAAYRLDGLGLATGRERKDFRSPVVSIITVS